MSRKWSIENQRCALGVADGTIDVLGHNKGTTLTLTSVGVPAHGTAVITPDSKVTYTYITTDALGQTTTARVTVTISAPDIQTGGKVLEAGFSPLVGLTLCLAVAVSAVALRRLRSA